MNTPAAENRVLIVEDSMPIRRMLGKILEAAGLEVAEAEHGQSALEVLERDGVESFHLLLVDLMMPVMDGKDFVKAARAKYAEALPPVIVVSSRSDRETIQGLRDLGLSGYVLKPFKSETVLSKVRDVLGLKKE